jgi:hypothetical protein
VVQAVGCAPGLDGKATGPTGVVTAAATAVAAA